MKHCAEYRFSDEADAKTVTRSIRRYFQNHYVGYWEVSKAGNQVLVCVGNGDDANKYFRGTFTRMGRIPDHVVM